MRTASTPSGQAEVPGRCLTLALRASTSGAISIIRAIFTGDCRACRSVETRARRSFCALRPVALCGHHGSPRQNATRVATAVATTTESGGLLGYDAGKKVNGRKRHIATDTLGLMLFVLVYAADV